MFLDEWGYNWLCTVWLTPVGQMILPSHYNDTIMSAMASQITSLTIVYSTVYSGAAQRKHQSSASLAFVKFPAQRASNAWNVSIWWRHHGLYIYKHWLKNPGSPWLRQNCNKTSTRTPLCVFLGRLLYFRRLIHFNRHHPVNFVLQIKQQRV